MTNFRVAVSRRGGPSNGNPLRHASLRSEPEKGVTTWPALCGAQVARTLPDQWFASGHPRSCAGCKRVVQRRLKAAARG